MSCVAYDGFLAAATIISQRIIPLIMPTLEEWQQALATPRYVYAVSSPGLLQEIQQLHAKKDLERQQSGKTIPPRKNTLSQVTALAPVRQLPIVPAYMLHRLGVVTTPAVENL